MSTKLPKGAVPTTWCVPRAGEWELVEGAVIEETHVCIQVNGRVLARFMATPMELDALALGFLRSEGIISGPEDVVDLRVGASGECVDVWLTRSAPLPDDGDAIRTAGCGGGVTFDDLKRFRPLGFPHLTLSPDDVIGRYFDMRAKETLYPITRGVHASALCSQDEVLLMAEDVGRHNTLDKLWGKALLAGVATRGRMIVTTGRISSEMLGKAAKMGVPIIASRTSPTSHSVALAQAWDMTLIGYVRRSGFRIYTGVERVG